MKYIKTVNENIQQLSYMKKQPKELFYIGNLDLLNKPLVSIVGTRRPISYTKDFTYKLASALSKRGVAIVSGAAMGVDAIAHSGAKAENTIAVMANGLDIKYPAVNKNLITQIEGSGLTLSFFKEGFRATRWSFVTRNELVVALGEVLIVAEADLNSGTQRSIEYAEKMGKKIYVLPHRINDSLATNKLLENKEAEAIYDIEQFADKFGKIEQGSSEFIEYLNTNPTIDEALKKYQDKIYEAELDGLIAIENGYIKVI